MIDPDNHIISRSLLAGVVVGIGGFLLLSSSSLFIGALLAAVCFLSCNILKLNLFTDKSGFLSETIDFRRLFLVLLLNLFAAFVFGVISKFLSAPISNAADGVLIAEINTDYLSCILKSVVTGFLLMLATESSIKSKNCIVPIICIIGFIYTACFNCVLDAFYYGASSLLYDNPSLILRLFIVAVFNFIGCNLYNLTVNRSFIHFSE